MKTTHRSKFYLAAGTLALGFGFLPPIDWRTIICLGFAIINFGYWWSERLDFGQE